MDNYRRHYVRNRVYIWDSNFGIRQQQSYQLDQTQIGRQQSSQTSLVDTFFKERRFDLEPPENVCAALRHFLQQADESDLQQDSVAGDNARLLALVDERCDRTGWKDHSSRLRHTRDWAQYAQHPPPGECQQRALLNAHGLYNKFGIPNVSHFKHL